MPQEIPSTMSLVMWEQTLISATFVALSHENTAGYALNAFTHGDVSDKEYRMLRDQSMEYTDKLIRIITNVFAELRGELSEATRLDI